MFNLYSRRRNRSRLIATLGHGLWLVISHAVSFTVLLSSVSEAQGSEDRGQTCQSRSALFSERTSTQ